MKQWFARLSKTSKVAVISMASILSIGSVGTFADQSQTEPVTTQATTAQSRAKEDIRASEPVLTTKQVTETEPVAFETSTVNNANLKQGTTRVAVEGANGTRTIVYEVTYKDKNEIGRSEVSSTITTQPVTKVIENGTKAPAPVASGCPNGTYINSAGNSVCSPYESSSVPADATAKCGDGTYSFSQSRRGTCSRHGGVAVWY